MKPYSIYVKKENGRVIDTQDEWGIVCKEFTFLLYGESKELPKRDWHDEDGEDTFFPSQLAMAAYDLYVEFGYKGAMDSANVAVRSFLDYLTGRDGSGTYLSVYDTYTKIGRQGVYFKSVGQDVFVRNTSEGDLVVFNVKFRVTDPMTEITLAV